MYGRVEIWVDGWWTGKKMNEQNKKASKTIDIVSLCLERESKLCHMCVCSPFQVIRHIKKINLA